MKNTEEDREKLMAILAGEDIARKRYLGDPSWKNAMEKAIEFQLEFKAKIIADPNTSDEKFFAASRDVCTLNLLRDKIKR